MPPKREAVRVWVLPESRVAELSLRVTPGTVTVHTALTPLPAVAVTAASPGARAVRVTMSPAAGETVTTRSLELFQATSVASAPEGETETPTCRSCPASSVTPAGVRVRAAAAACWTTTSQASLARSSPAAAVTVIRVWPGARAVTEAEAPSPATWTTEASSVLQVKAAGTPSTPPETRAVRAPCSAAPSWSSRRPGSSATWSPASALPSPARAGRARVRAREQAHSRERARRRRLFMAASPLQNGGYLVLSQAGVTVK